MARAHGLVTRSRWMMRGSITSHAAKDTTGAVLEEGPAVLYDGGVYSGEAMVPYTARGAGVKLGYAKDLATRCRRRG